MINLKYVIEIHYQNIYYTANIQIDGKIDSDSHDINLDIKSGIVYLSFLLGSE